MKLKGYVFGTDGSALEGATVNYYVALEGAPSSALGTTTTDANGMWSFSPASVGTYDVKIQFTVGGSAQVRWLKGLSAVQADEVVGYTDSNLERVLARSVVDVAIGTTAAETTVISQSVPAGILGTTRTVKVTIEGDYVNNTGGNQSLLWKLKLGATTVVNSSSGSINLATGGNTRPFIVEATITNRNSANAQYGYLAVKNRADATTNLEIDLLSTGTASEDTSSAKTLVVTVQHSISSVNLVLTARVIRIEIL
ncbi:MAG: carboxypeptidase-like regulatory domain-containing protein [Chloroflexi bacterium]|nr:carboxypeptidase-like regulatory domain-containing protein [Chloroflexota bacterium]